jgi:tetratricopeptide (TPR) repeat protein/TolB-like protein/DNA-binding winged helix-turn-helix (wHTH) protein
LNSELLQGFYLGDLFVEPLKGQVSGKGEPRHLPPKAAEVLLCLARTPGELVARDDLLKEVWGQGQGSKEALSHAVGEIRHALGDHADQPVFIQTLRKRGYRLALSPVPAAQHTESIVFGAQSTTAGLGLFENLKERGVLETALAYLIFGWLLIQIADIVFAQLHLPSWAGTFVTVLVITGFPIALMLSWFLEFRDGRATLHDLTPVDARRRRFSRTYFSVLAALGIAGIFVLTYDRSIGLPEADQPPATIADGAIRLPPVLENSIAVLPFLNIDGSGHTQIFANGLVDDVITRLARVPGLLVSARGDSYTLEPNTSSQKVRERLRVAMYLEGSVQTLGDELRVIVQLINSETGFHVLSRSFDRPSADFFNIRDEITELTVANVRVSLSPDTRIPSAPAGDDPSLDAYILYRRGVDASRLPTVKSTAMAVEWYDAALEIDPDFAAAHAGKCSAYVGRYAEDRDAESLDSAESSCASALTLNPNLEFVHTALGNLYQTTGQYEKALSEYRQALLFRPDNVSALTGTGAIYGLLQDPERAEESLRKAIGVQPGNWSAYNALGAFLFNSGRYEAAAEQYEYVVALDSANMVALSNLGTAYLLNGDFANAAPALRRAIDIEPRSGTYGSLGLVHYYLGDFDEAVVAHQHAIRLAPSESLNWSNLGDAFWVAGYRDEARSAFESAEELATTALEVNPNDPYAQMDLAWINAMLGHEAHARDLIDRALPQTDDPYAHFVDGLIYFRGGDADKALDALEIAITKGYSVTMIAAEPHLGSLRTNPRFVEMTQAAEAQ